MIARLFHAWERRLVSVTTDRVIRPFDWGLDWVGHDAHAETPAALLRAHARRILDDSDRYFHADPAADYRLDHDVLRFSSALTTPHVENNTVVARLFRGRAAPTPRTRAAVLVLPQWNAAADGHVALCRILARTGLDALRLSLPYHDLRMPPELRRADYIVSANIGRTLEVCRQAVLDARLAIAWLAQEGYERIGILGTSLGSCLALLTAAHEPRVRAAALNHVSPFFADVVWEGLSTQHIRQSLEGPIDLELLRELWLPISPWPYLGRMRGTRMLLVYGRFDLTFPVHLSRRLVDEFHRRGIPHELAVLPCGHYSTAVPPFAWLDGYFLVRFLRRHLAGDRG